MDGFCKSRGRNHAECTRHGPDAMGSTYAPIDDFIKEGLSFDDYAVIMNGRGEAEGAQKGNACYFANTNGPSC